eukprot:45674-Eustigmatos_ZCMA.PRE.1
MQSEQKRPINPTTRLSFSEKNISTWADPYDVLSIHPGSQPWGPLCRALRCCGGGPWAQVITIRQRIVPRGIYSSEPLES